MADPEETPWEGTVQFDYDAASDQSVGQTRQFLSAPVRAPMRVHEANEIIDEIVLRWERRDDRPYDH